MTFVPDDCLDIGASDSGVHDVLHSCGNVWYGNGRCDELYGCVGDGGVGAVPGSMVVEVLNRRQR